jgi:hypothetical protein
VRPLFSPFFALPFFGFNPFWLQEQVLLAGAFAAGAPLPMPLPEAGVPTGGVQLDVEPWRAQVYVDGYYAGHVEDFRGYYHHLELPAGPHVIEIFEAGFQPQNIEVSVSPGRTTTYRGILERAPGR